MLGDPITLSLTGPLAEKVRAAAEACGMTVDEWAAQAIQRRMNFEREARRQSEQADTEGM